MNILTLCYAIMYMKQILPKHFKHGITGFIEDKVTCYAYNLVYIENNKIILLLLKIHKKKYN